MSEKFEQHIEEWYSKSQTRSLNFLDISEASKITSSDLARNLEVIHNKVCLSTKVSLDQFQSLKKENLVLKNEVLQLRRSVAALESDLIKQRQPILTESLAGEILESRKIAEELKKNLDEVKLLLKEVKTLIGE